VAATRQRPSSKAASSFFARPASSWTKQERFPKKSFRPATVASSSADTLEKPILQLGKDRLAIGSLMITVNREWRLSKMIDHRGFAFKNLEEIAVRV
jgi:hypothetical protein